MRVLLLNHSHEYFGTYFRCRALGEELAARGHTVRLVCASGTNFDLRRRRQNSSPGFEILTLPRIKYHTYYTGQLLRLPLYCAEVAAWRCDLVHAFTVAQPQIGLAALLARLLRKPLIIDWDDLWGDGFGSTHGPLVNTVLKGFEEGLLPIASAITVASRFLMDRCRAILPATTPALLLPNGCQPSVGDSPSKHDCRRLCGLPDEAKILLSMGNTYVGGLGFLLDAFRAALQAEPRSRLILVGHVELPDSSEVRQWQAAKRLIRTSFITGDALQYHLAAADVLALPMSDHPIEQARFPVRLAHYLAMGRPVVSNAVGEVHGYLTRYGGGLTSPHNDAAAFAANVLRLFRNPALADELGRQARDVARTKLAWSRIAADLDSFYREVVERRTRRTRRTGVNMRTASSPALPLSAPNHRRRPHEVRHV